MPAFAISATCLKTLGPRTRLYVSPAAKLVVECQRKALSYMTTSSEQGYYRRVSAIHLILQAHDAGYDNQTLVAELLAM